MNPIKFLKRKFYFLTAAYFQFWAKLYLKKWQPTVITVTGSSGKTTLLHLFEAELGDKALYSHKANSTFGIPFHILGLERKSFRVYEWLVFFAKAPFRAFRKIHAKKIYVTEVDAERPGEASSLARLLEPDILVWLSLEEAHGIQYDRLVDAKVHGEALHSDRKMLVKKEMAQEFGMLLEYTKKFAVLDSDNSFITPEANRSHAEIKYVSEKDVHEFTYEKTGVKLKTSRGMFSVPVLLPKVAGLSVYAVASVLKYLNIPIDSEFKNLKLPPGRSSVFLGKKGTTLIDSTYNATFDGVKAMLDLIRDYPASGERWLVLGDMIEQGKSEAEEHTLLGRMIVDVHPAKIVLVGPRLAKNTVPVILQHSEYSGKVFSCMRPDEALIYLEKELHGGETILFKGARFLEGIVEKLLADPNDAKKLCRREKIWIKRRKEWGV